MKYWRGYLTAAIFGIFTFALQEFADTHATLVDMIYPYISRLLQTSLAQWSSGVDFCLWQMAAVLLILAVVVSIILMVVLRWNPIQWLGWVLAGASVLFFLHTAIYGLNNYAGSIADDIRMEQVEYTVSELADATIYYRDKANELSEKVKRDESGNVDFPEFAELAEMAAEGFDTLVYDQSYSIFAGSKLPVKELGWADMYSSMGITGITMGLTGEAAVNPQIPPVSLPFTICHEMAHRMCIATEKDANFAAFLACAFHSGTEFQYSAYYMAYRYCYAALAGVGTSAATQMAQDVASGVSDTLWQDLDTYNDFFSTNKNNTATNAANKVNDAYIKASGDDEGIDSYNNVSSLLVSWYNQEVVVPSQVVEEMEFDPFDKTQVDVSDIIGSEG